MLSLLAAVIAVGCGVPADEYQEVLKNLDAARAELEAVNKKIVDLEAEVAACRETDAGYWRDALRAEEDGDWATVRTTVQELLRRWPQTPYTAEAQSLDKKAVEVLASVLYQQGETSVENKGFEAARKVFQEIVEKYPSTSSARQAKLSLRDLDRRIEEARVRAIGNGQWYVREETSPVDDSTNVYLSLRAEDTIRSRFGKSVRPSLYVRCKENKTEVFINWGVYLGIDQTHVLQRFDGKRAATVLWNISTDHEATFYRSGHIAFARQLVRHEKLLLQTTPYGESPVMVSFRLEGLRSAIKPLRKACGW